MAQYIFGTEAKNLDGVSSKVVSFPTDRLDENNVPVESVAKKSNVPHNYKVGEKQEVYPFKKVEDLVAMKNYFQSKGHDRDLLMFVLGINIGLRASDLLTLRWSNLLDSDGTVADGITVQMEGITVKEDKTNKFRTFYLNESCKKAIQSYLENHKVNLSDFVFASQKGGAVEVRSANKILKTAAKACGIKFNVGTHSMRKTFGYHQLKAHADDAMFLCQLQQMFNHSSPQITLRYCGLEGEQISTYYRDVNLL